MTDDYSITWRASARRAVRRLPEKTAAAVVEFLYESVASNPQRVGKPLRFGLAGLHSARRGEYRVIYQIHPNERSVEIVTIEHRADVYRERNW